MQACVGMPHDTTETATNQNMQTSAASKTQAKHMKQPLPDMIDEMGHITRMTNAKLLTRDLRVSSMMGMPTGGGGRRRAPQKANTRQQSSVGPKRNGWGQRRRIKRLARQAGDCVWDRGEETPGSTVSHTRQHRQAMPTTQHRCGKEHTISIQPRRRSLGAGRL